MGRILHAIHRMLNPSVHLELCICGDRRFVACARQVRGSDE